jgi:hypothetical protein
MFRNVRNVENVGNARDASFENGLECTSNLQNAILN